MSAPDPDAPLVIDADGNLEIPDHKGRVLTYLWEVVPPGLDDWRVILRRVDGDAGPYEVTRTPGGRYRCTCADTRFGRPKRELRQCKHRHAVAKLWIIKGRLDRVSDNDQQEAEAR